METDLTFRKDGSLDVDITNTELTEWLSTDDRVYFHGPTGEWYLQSGQSATEIAADAKADGFTVEIEA